MSSESKKETVRITLPPRPAQGVERAPSKGTNRISLPLRGLVARPAAPVPMMATSPTPPPTPMLVPRPVTSRPAAPAPRSGAPVPAPSAPAPNAPIPARPPAPVPRPAPVAAPVVPAVLAPAPAAPAAVGPRPPVPMPKVPRSAPPSPRLDIAPPGVAGGASAPRAVPPRPVPVTRKGDTARIEIPEESRAESPAAAVKVARPQPLPGQPAADFSPASRVVEEAEAPAVSVVPAWVAWVVLAGVLAAFGLQLLMFLTAQ